jgi:DNA-binding response OmpR family regulator
MNIKYSKFAKRLTLLFIKEITHSYDEWLVDNFGSLVLAYDVKDGLTKFNKNYIDLVLIELENNYEEKFQLIEEIRKKRPFILILILTKDKKYTTLTKNIELGIDGYFTHPIDNQQP